MTYAADGGQRDSAAVGTAPPPARVPATVLAEHQAAVAAISEAYAALPPGSPVRLAKRTSNLFRFRDPLPGRAAGTTGRGRRRDGRRGGARTGGGRGRVPRRPGARAGRAVHGPAAWTCRRSAGCCTSTRRPARRSSAA